jgi:hypothetical protein
VLCFAACAFGTGAEWPAGGCTAASDCGCCCCCCCALDAAEDAGAFDCGGVGALLTLGGLAAGAGSGMFACARHSRSRAFSAYTAASCEAAASFSCRCAAFRAAWLGAGLDAGIVFVVLLCFLLRARLFLPSFPPGTDEDADDGGGGVVATVRPMEDGGDDDDSSAGDAGDDEDDDDDDSDDDIGEDSGCTGGVTVTEWDGCDTDVDGVDDGGDGDAGDEDDDDDDDDDDDVSECDDSAVAVVALDSLPVGV